METINLQDNVVIITGAGQGLGEAYAKILGKMGAKLVLNDIAMDNGVPLAELAAKNIQELGGVAIADTNSVTSEKGIENIINNALSRFNRIDAIIHNAGILVNQPIEEMTLTDWKKVIDVHLNGAFLLINKVFSHFIKQNYGRIVLITSSAGLYGLPYQLSYAAAKMGVVGMAKSITAESVEWDICCNVLSPLASTSQTNEVLGDEFNEHLVPEKVAPIIPYLCSTICKEKGNIYVAGGGYISRIGIFEGKGVLFNEDEISADDILTKMSEINDMENAKHITSILQAAKRILKNLIKKNKTSAVSK